MSGRASFNPGRRTDVREVNQPNAFMEYLVGGVCAVRKNMNAKEHTRANKWAAHVKESSMNRRDEVLKRAQPTLLQKYSDPLMAIGHDQTQFEIPVVDHIVDKTMDGLNLRNPVATDLLTKAEEILDQFDSRRTDDQ
jgi:hypothetical protein